MEKNIIDLNSVKFKFRISIFFFKSKNSLELNFQIIYGKIFIILLFLISLPFAPTRKSCMKFLAINFVGLIFILIVKDKFF